MLSDAHRNTCKIQRFLSKVALMAIIGEEGFLVLYSRSLHLLRPTFPMLPPADTPPSAKAWLADLDIALTGQDPIEANAANTQLMMTLTNILASLIGEDLTVEILHSAWGDAPANKNPARKEMEDDK
jgi:hypothetical protein